jgi:phosphoribosylformylglycinamidine synthase II
MSSKGGLGIQLELDRVPVRETGMVPYEIMLSESQERMLMVIRPEARDQARAIFEKWELDFAEIGKLTDSGHLVLRWHGDVACDIPVEPLVSEAPVYDRPWVATPARPDIDASSVTANADIGAALVTLIGAPDLASRRWIWEQYDHLVMGHTRQRPGGDAAVVRLPGTNRGLALTTDCTPRYCHADPQRGGAQAVVESWRNLTSVGATPLAITDNMNFGNPERPEIMGQFVGCVEGMREACLALDYPVVSGNVSFYNETNGKGILPTPVIGGVGLIDDVNRVAFARFDKPGLELVLVGETAGHLGSSLWLREIAGREEGAPPPVDFKAERRHGDFVRKAIRELGVTQCHDLSDGGLLVAAAEMALAGNCGATIQLPEGSAIDAVAWLFGEDQARYLLAVEPGTLAELRRHAATDGVPLASIGRTGGDALTVPGMAAISLQELRNTHENWLPRYMSGGA